MLLFLILNSVMEMHNFHWPPCMNKPWRSDELVVRRSEVRGGLTPESTGMSVYRQRGGGGRGAQRNVETQGEGARGADVPYLLSFLVRAQVWTVMCMLVDVTSGLQGTQAWVSPDPGGWHKGVKSGDVMGRRAPHGEVAMGWTKKHCELTGFSVCCQTCNYKPFF